MPIQILIKEGEFQGVKPFETDLYIINLKETTTNKLNNKKIITESLVNYTLKVDLSKISPIKIEELNKEMKSVFGMNFVPYDYNTKTYNYFTTKYQDLDSKIKKLNIIFERLKEFEEEYKIYKKESLKLFESDSKNHQEYEYQDEEIKVTYNEELESFIVIPFGFLGKDKYSTLAKSSSKIVKLLDINNENIFIQDEKLIKKNPNVFVISNLAYKNVKGFIEKIKTEKEIFTKEQSDIISNENEIPNYTDKNIFDFKIELNKDTKCFNFYSKGFKESRDPISGYYVERGLLGNIALNFILSEYNNEDIIPNMYVADNGCDENKVKYKIKTLITSAGRNIVVPATEIDKLKLIYENFKKINSVFGRKEHKIKINDLSLYRVSESKYPSIYLSEEGKYYLIYSYRNSSRNNVNSSITLRGVEVNLEEYKNYMNNHDWADKIRDNTKYLNSTIYTNNDNLNIEEINKVFESIEMRSFLLNDINKNKVSTKKIKI